MPYVQGRPSPSYSTVYSIASDLDPSCSLLAHQHPSPRDSSSSVRCTADT